MTATGETAPRTLDDLGDGAFLDDVLKDQGPGLHRDVTVVFRMANVLVTVELSQWSTDKSVEPPSEELRWGLPGRGGARRSTRRMRRSA